MDLLHILKTRYATKVYDPSRKIPEETAKQLLEALRYSPSSVNAQPWHFIVASDEAGKKRLAKGAPQTSEVSYNWAKIMDASHVVLLCARDTLSDSYLEEVLEKESKDGRFSDDTKREWLKEARAGYVQMHRDAGDVAIWNQKQVYLAQGFLLLSAAALGIDATPIEGFIPELLEEEFGLKEKGLTPQVIVSLGYHAEQDNNATQPKSRLDESVVFSKA